METTAVRQILAFLATLAAWAMTDLAFAGQYDLLIEKNQINLTP
jgi:hypothetical protein